MVSDNGELEPTALPSGAHDHHAITLEHCTDSLRCQVANLGCEQRGHDLQDIKIKVVSNASDSILVNLHRDYLVSTFR